jgi:hypothetical protein
MPAIYMLKALAQFWIRRFVLVFVLAFSGLVGLRLLRGDPVTGVLWFSAIWAGATAFVAASIATYSAYRIRCKAVFDPVDDRSPANKDT